MHMKDLVHVLYFCIPFDNIHVDARDEQLLNCGTSFSISLGQATAQFCFIGYKGHMADCIML